MLILEHSADFWGSSAYPSELIPKVVKLTNSFIAKEWQNSPMKDMIDIGKHSMNRTCSGDQSAGTCSGDQNAGFMEAFTRSVAQILRSTLNLPPSPYNLPASPYSHQTSCPQTQIQVATPPLKGQQEVSMRMQGVYCNKYPCSN